MPVAITSPVDLAGSKTLTTVTSPIRKDLANQLAPKILDMARARSMRAGDPLREEAFAKELGSNAILARDGVPTRFCMIPRRIFKATDFAWPLNPQRCSNRGT